MAWTLVTPASRGIGLALTRQLLITTPPSLPVIATARSDLEGTKARILEGLPDAQKHKSRLDVQKIDLNSESSISDCAAYCMERYNNKEKEKSAHLRLGFLVPGMLVPERAPEKIDHDSALATLKLNLLAPMLLIKHFTRFLPRQSVPLSQIHGTNDNAAVLALMSARVGSISDNERGGWYSYRATKAGVNQLVKSLDNHLKMGKNGNKAMAVGLHPGTVRTELSREFWEGTPQGKLFEPQFAAECLVNVVRGLKVDEGRGRCWAWDGKEILP